MPESLSIKVLSANSTTSPVLAVRTVPCSVINLFNCASPCCLVSSTAINAYAASSCFPNY